MLQDKTDLKASVFSIDGKKLKQISLPKVFSEEYHPALIKRAVLSIQSARFQPKGPERISGRKNTAEYVGVRWVSTMHRSINVGKSRLPRLGNRRGRLAGNVAGIGQSVGGPKSHPVKPQKKLLEEINAKEKRKALRSAIAATLMKELVLKKHRVDKALELPVVIESGFEKILKTKEVVKALKALKLFDDVMNAKEKRKIRAGKGKKRGRKYKGKKSLLIVTGENANVYKAARNLSGVEVCPVNSLNAELLAPGTEAGRLTVWTEDAIKKLEAL